MIVLVVAVISAGLISRPSADKVPEIRFSVVNSTLVVNGATQTPYSISITHDGGDEINDGNYAVFIDGIRTTDFTVNPDPDKKWSVGRTITVNSSSAPGLVSVYYTGSNSPTLLGQRVLGTITTPSRVPPILYLNSWSIWYNFSIRINWRKLWGKQGIHHYTLYELYDSRCCSEWGVRGSFTDLYIPSGYL